MKWHVNLSAQWRKRTTISLVHIHIIWWTVVFAVEQSLLSESSILFLLIFRIFIQLSELFSVKTLLHHPPPSKFFCFLSFLCFVSNLGHRLHFFWCTFISLCLIFLLIKYFCFLVLVSCVIQFSREIFIYHPFQEIFAGFVFP